MISVIIIITSVYLILILSFSYGIIKNNVFGLERKPSIQTFSIIIPFRNEEIHLRELLNSLVKINYPKNKFECIECVAAMSEAAVLVSNKSETLACLELQVE